VVAARTIVMMEKTHAFEMIEEKSILRNEKEQKLRLRDLKVGNTWEQKNSLYIFLTTSISHLKIITPVYLISSIGPWRAFRGPGSQKGIRKAPRNGSGQASQG